MHCVDQLRCGLHIPSGHLLRQEPNRLPREDLGLLLEEDHGFAHHSGVLQVLNGGERDLHLINRSDFYVPWDRIAVFMADHQDRLDSLQERIKDPRRFIMNLQMNLDDLRDRLTSAFDHQKKNLGHHITRLELRLQHRSPAWLIKEKKMLLKNIRHGLSADFSSRVTALKNNLYRNATLLESLSPLAVLQRGYSITRSIPGGAVIRQTDNLNEGDRVNVLLAKGNFNAKIEKIFQGD